MSVNSTADDGNGTCTASKCTLRDAISNALSGDTINFSLPANSTITLTSGELFINQDLTINGPGANLLTVQRSAGASDFRIFNIQGNVTISGLKIFNGKAQNPPSGPVGGGISNDRTLTLTNVTISGNTSANTGGGILNRGTLTVLNSTISDNIGSNGGGGILNAGSSTVTNSTISGNHSDAAGGFGGGIYNVVGTVTFINSTLSRNSAGSSGAGIYNDTSKGFGGTVRAKNSIIALNTTFSGPDFFGPLTSDGFNLIGNNRDAQITSTTTDQIGTAPHPIDPMLGPLKDNGGPTETEELLSASTAIDKGNSGGSNTDQRGFARPVDDPGPGFPNATGGDGSDIGAYEVQADLLPDCKNINRIVNNNNDSGTDSLRDVIANVCPGSTITFAQNVTGAINLTSGELLINKGLIIKGPGARALTISGNNASRIFNTNVANISVTISGLTIANGSAPGSDGGAIYNAGTLSINSSTISGNSASSSSGGGIYNTGGTLAIANSTISGNATSSGGGIMNTNNTGNGTSGRLTITNSTISGNSASSFAGGISSLGTATITNSTISGNSAGAIGGGGIFNGGGTVSASNTIVALNTSASGPDFKGALTSQGFNLIGDSSGATISPAQFSDQIGVTAGQLNLGPLQDNGGPTQTHGLLSGSFAIDKGNSSGLSTDQRGFTRPVGIASVSGGDGSDIGAFEVGLLVPLSAVSRKTHGATNFDIDLPLTGATIGIECRRNTGADVSGPNAGRDHELIVTFPSAVTVGGASVTSNDATDTPTATSSVSSNIVTVDLHNIPNARRLSVNLTNVSDGTTTNNVSVPMGVLVGDTTGDGNVNSGDIAQTKSKSGQTVVASNFRADLTVDGNLNSGDIALVKSKSGTALPP